MKSNRKGDDEDEDANNRKRDRKHRRKRFLKLSSVQVKVESRYQMETFGLLSASHSLICHLPSVRVTIIV